MNLSITKQTLLFAVMTVLFFGLSLTSVYAHTDEENTDHAESVIVTKENDTPQIAQMKNIIALLTQLVTLLQEKIEAQDNNVHNDSSEGLAVWIEIHSNRAHAHVKQTGQELDTFFVDEYKYTQEDEIITAIANKTGLSVDKIKGVIIFPSGIVDENGDSMEGGSHPYSKHVETNTNDDEDIDGIHIMNNGAIMNGNGEEITGATITSDGMIMLSNGDIVEPELDLR